MKKLLASLLAFAGLAGAAPQESKVQTLDPKSILFSTPTISNDTASLEPGKDKPGASDFIFHEDEWSQLEFLGKNRLAEVQRMLKEFKNFEQANRVQHGWRNVYVRKIQRLPLIAGPGPVQKLEHLLNSKAGPAPMLFSSSTVSGQVKGGFSLPLGGSITLYGYVADQNIPVLGASVGKDPDDSKLTQAFIKLNASNGLILVDWRAQLVLVSVGKSGQIEVWRP
ncbi:MAG: hypothetical protein IPH08_10415 [Rhodocyclaceae bacterium]|nr:hypothetical protein [Rhodocyclaceae bacterium]